MGNRIDYRINYEKAIETIVWLASEKPGIDIYHLGKVLFYADKKHYLVLFYACQTSYQPAPDGCRYFAPEEIRDLDCLPGTYEVVDIIVMKFIGVRGK